MNNVWVVRRGDDWREDEKEEEAKARHSATVVEMKWESLMAWFVIVGSEMVSGEI